MRVRRLARCVCEHAAPGERALLLYPPGLEFVEAFLACLAAGVIAVPAYPPRRNRKSERLRAIARDAGPRLVLTTSRALPAVEADVLGKHEDWVCLATDAIELAADHDRPLPSPAGGSSRSCNTRLARPGLPEGS